jgi:hypothetical protein
VKADSEDIRRFREAMRLRIEHTAQDTGRGTGDIPPAALLSLLVASGFSAVARAQGQTKLATGDVLGVLIAAAIDSLRTGHDGRPASRGDLEREIFRRIQQVLAMGGAQAAMLRAEIARVLQVTDAMSGALRVAIETGNDRLRSETLAAIATLSSEFPELMFLARTGDDAAAHMERRPGGRAAGLLLDRGGGGNDRPWTVGCPYLGLLPFDQAHAAVFRGRQRLTTELMAKLAGRLAGPAMIVVSGASGAGKSSLLHAGLLPALADGTQLPGSARWPRVVMTPGSDPVAELATQLATLGGGDAAALQAALAADPDRAQLAVGQAIRADAVWRAAPQLPVDGGPERLVIVVDQFEEVFTLASGRDGARQRAFIAALIAAATHPFGPHGQPPALVVIAVRGDFWARCAADPGLARIMQDGLFVAGPMTEPELREAITGPAAAAGLQIDANLADIILADLRTADRDEAGGNLAAAVPGDDADLGQARG